MKNLLLLSLFIFAPIVVLGQVNAGVMDYEEAISSLPEIASIEAELDQFIQEREAAFETRYQVYIDEITLYSEQMEAGTLSSAQQREKEAELAELEDELTALQNRIQNQVRQKQNELYLPLLNRVDDAIAIVSERLNLDFVMKKNSNSGDPFVFFASERSINITEQVVQQLTQN